jgi:hypothetical protein
LLDHTVKSHSASLIFKMVGSQTKVLRWIAGGPHGLIAQNYGATWEVLDAFVEGKSGEVGVTGTSCADAHKIIAERVAPSRNAARWLTTKITRTRLKAG